MVFLLPGVTATSTSDVAYTQTVDIEVTTEIYTAAATMIGVVTTSREDVDTTTILSAAATTTTIGVIATSYSAATATTL